MLSRDKDLGQLVDEKVTLFDPQKGGDLGLEQLFDSKGVRPDQVIDLLALMGDTADNVPGVPGVGPKTAAALLAEYGSIEGIYENLSKIKGKKGEAIAASRELVALSRKLVTLKDDCEIPFTETAANFDPKRCDLPALLELLRVLGFHRLQSEAKEIFGGETSARGEREGNAPDEAGASAGSTRRKGARSGAASQRSSEADDGGLFASLGRAASPDHGGSSGGATSSGDQTAAHQPSPSHEAALFGTLFDAVAASAGPPISARPMIVHVVRTESELALLVDRLRRAGR
jgi:DNA polymerase-1